MIGWPQILVTALLTALAVEITGMAVHWPVSATLSASVAALLLIVAWRGASNVLSINGDFLPAVSPADVGSLLVGAIGPALTVRFGKVPPERSWRPVLVGAVIAFVANVLFL